MKRFILTALLALAATAAQANPRFEYVPSTLLEPASTDFTQGKAGAPITLIEYASLSCPHCAHFHSEVLPVLKTKYIDTGKMLYILRPYPLNEPALKAAELVDCVGGKEGALRYYAFVSVLFDTQNKWAFDTAWQSALATISRVGGVSPDMYEQCTADKQREIKVLTMKQEATNIGVDHTPYIFINSRRYDDDTSPAKISAYIDKLLAGAAAPEKPVKKPAKKPAEKPVATPADKPADTPKDR